jgi:hypothetical protein
MPITPKQNRTLIDNQQKLLEAHSKHLEIANEEMGEVKIDINVLKNDVAWIKDSIRTHGTLLWSILSVLILGTLISIALKMI